MAKLESREPMPGARVEILVKACSCMMWQIQ
jgi:hypothetical protein